MTASTSGPFLDVHGADISRHVAQSLDTVSTLSESRAQRCTTLSRILIQASITAMSLDPIFSMLPESTITFPAIAIAHKRRSSAHCPAHLSPVKKSHKGISLRRPLKESLGKLASVANFLCQVMNNLSDLRSMVVRTYSSTTLSQMCAAFVNAVMLLSFVQPEAIGVSIYPALVAYAIGTYL